MYVDGDFRWRQWVLDRRDVQRRPGGIVCVKEVFCLYRKDAQDKDKKDWESANSGFPGKYGR